MSCPGTPLELRAHLNNGSVKFLFSVLHFQHMGKKKPGCGQGWPLPQCTAASARAENRPATADPRD